MLNDEVRAIWNANAEFWDARMGEGNDFHTTLIEPTQLKLLEIKPGQRILDVACGNGQFARKMTELGARVTATDFSEKMIQTARSKGHQNIDYVVIDATDQVDLLRLDGQAFDSIVCTMAMMDMESIEVLVTNAPRLLKAGGIFVFSILHPCFNSGDCTLVHERDDWNGRINSRYAVKVRDYLLERSVKGEAMSGQPQLQYYFHRPVSTILNLFFKAGFVLDGYEEPSFINVEDPGSIFGNVYKYVPPALVCRLRLG